MDSLPPPQRAAAPCSPAAALPLNGQGTATPTPMDIAPAAVLLNNSQATGAPAAPMEKPPSAPVNGQEEKGASSMESLPPAVVRPPPDSRPMEPPCIVERVFREFTYRRVALVRALTTDEKAFSRKCIPGMVSMYLYGHTDGSWEVQSLELPMSLGLPKPKAGINLARDNMKHQEWLEHIAMHCDAWLIRISFFLAAKLEPSERDRLFTMINSLQTVYEKFVSSDTYRRICKNDFGPATVQMGTGSAVTFVIVGFIINA
ncbi:hypothetical protein ACP70R_028437 [Stipagrostis hirtigluma subsp. patula]